MREGSSGSNSLGLTRRAGSCSMGRLAQVRCACCVVVHAVCFAMPFVVAVVRCCVCWSCAMLWVEAVMRSYVLCMSDCVCWYCQLCSSLLFVASVVFAHDMLSLLFSALCADVDRICLVLFSGKTALAMALGEEAADMANFIRIDATEVASRGKMSGADVANPTFSCFAMSGTAASHAAIPDHAFVMRCPVLMLSRYLAMKLLCDFGNDVGHAAHLGGLSSCRSL